MVIYLKKTKSKRKLKSDAHVLKVVKRFFFFLRDTRKGGFRQCNVFFRELASIMLAGTKQNI